MRMECYWLKGAVEFAKQEKPVGTLASTSTITAIKVKAALVMIKLSGTLA